MSGLISVIVPAFNAEKWLIDCVSSVIGQTYTNWELIILDDGSEDATFQIADQLAQNNKKITVIHTENGGVCRARNLGLDAAKGEYIFFLDADDLMMTYALEKLYAQLSSSSADIAIGWKTNMKSDGTELGCPYDRMYAVWTQKQALEQSLLDNPATYAVWGKLYRKELISDVRFVEGKRVHEDSFFVFQCFVKQPTVVVVDDIVLRYRISENSVSRSAFSEKVFDILYFAERKKYIVEKEYPEFISLSENMIVKAYMALLWNLLKTDDPKYKDIQKSAIRNVLDRKAYYKAAIQSDKKLFWILTHRLYGIYKAIYLLREKILNHEKS